MKNWGWAALVIIGFAWVYSRQSASAAPAGQPQGPSLPVTPAGPSLPYQTPDGTLIYVQPGENPPLPPDGYYWGVDFTGSRMVLLPLGSIS
jgi:hypothetical protein